mmetsp:Transcript_66990/g.160504  ORF Transcript_66990/g.160504 Transcript_66990/m.160504 type:complete len:209 (-) Transcript_66990:683-1309(-)
MEVVAACQPDRHASLEVPPEAHFRAGRAKMPVDCLLQQDLQGKAHHFAMRHADMPPGVPLHALGPEPGGGAGAQSQAGRLRGTPLALAGMAQRCGEHVSVLALLCCRSPPPMHVDLQSSCHSHAASAAADHRANCPAVLRCSTTLPHVVGSWSGCRCSAAGQTMDRCPLGQQALRFHFLPHPAPRWPPTRTTYSQTAPGGSAPRGGSR